MNWSKGERSRPTEEEVAEELLQLEGPPNMENARDKCYIHLVTLLGDLQTRMLITFEFVSRQVADQGESLDEALKETTSMRKLIKRNHVLLQGVDARLKEVERVQLEWREENREADRLSEEANKEDDDED